MNRGELVIYITMKNRKKNLKRLVDVVCYLEEQKLPLQEHGEAQNSVNKFRGNYIELLIK